VLIYPPISLPVFHYPNHLGGTWCWTLVQTFVAGYASRHTSLAIRLIRLLRLRYARRQQATQIYPLEHVPKSWDEKSYVSFACRLPAMQ
jgi:hypothetical protein